jgi:hypothetical protein
MFHKQRGADTSNEFRTYAATHPLTKIIHGIAFELHRTSRFVVAPGEWPKRFLDGPADNHRNLLTESMEKCNPKTGARDLEPLPDCPSIIDPANPDNDVGARAYAYHYIRTTMRLESLRLLTSMLIMDEAVDGKPNGWRTARIFHTPDPDTKSLLLPLIGNYHDRVRARRNQAEAYGQKILSGEIVPPVYSPRVHAETVAETVSAAMTFRSEKYDSSESSVIDASESRKARVASRPAPDINAAQFDLVEDEENAPDVNEKEETLKPNGEGTLQPNELKTSEPNELKTSEPNEEETLQSNKEEISVPDDKETGSAPS